MSELPDGWARASVDDTGLYINGMAFKPTDWEHEGRPIIRIQNLTDPDKPLNRTRKQVPERYIVAQGDLLVSWSATLDAFIWDREEAVLNQHIFKVVPSTDVVDPRFLFFGLKEVIAEMRESEHLHGSTMKHINRGPFLAHDFPIPPLPEQRRIVAKLDRLSTRSRAARNHLTRTAALAARAKRAILAAEVARGKECNRITAGNLFQWSSGRNLPKNRQVAGKYVVYGGNGPQGTHDKFNRDEETIVIGRVGALCGNVHRTTGPAWITDNAIFASEIDRSVDMKFATYVFTAENLNQKAGGSGQPYVNQGILNAVEFPSISLDLQQRAVRLIEAAFARIDRIVEEATRAAHLLDRLDERLLAKAFRGELVPQDPNDEPAEVLLARIREAQETTPRKKRGRRPRVA